MKQIIFVVASILSLLAGLTAQSSICVTGPGNSGSSSKNWYFNLVVTDPAGITMRSIRMQASSAGGTPNCRLYLRTNGGPASSGNINNSAGWTQQDEVTHAPMGNDYYFFDFADIYFPPGTYGVGLQRGGNFQRILDGLVTATGSEASIVTLGGSSSPFAGLVNTSKSAKICVNYDVGPDGQFDLSAEAPSGTLLATPLTASPADLSGNSGGVGLSTLFYPNGTTVSFSAPSETAGGSLMFDHWTIGGVAQTLFQRNISQTSSGNQILKATYDFPRIVTLNATCDGMAVAPSIANAPSDRFNTSSVIAGSSVLEFRRLTEVTFTADPFVGDCAFQRWLVDGVPVTTTVLTTTIAADTNIVAEYGKLESCYESDIGSGLGMANDTLSTNHALGFSFPVPGGGTTNAVDISSNGFLWLETGSSPEAAPAFSLSSLWLNPPRICALWHSLVMASNDSDVYFRSFGDRAVITWKNLQVINRPEIFTLQCTMYPSGRVLFAHIGDLPQVQTITGVVAGNSTINQPAPVNIATQSSWNSNFEAGWFWQPLSSGHGARVFSTAPTTTGFAGVDQTGLCSMAMTQSYGTGCAGNGASDPASFYQANSGANLAGTSYRMTPLALGGYTVDASPTNLFETAIGTATGIGDDALYTVSLPFSFGYATNPAGSNSIDVCSNGFIWLASGTSTSTAYSPSATSLFNMPSRIAPFWVDLDPTAALSDDVYVNVHSNRVVITWHDCVRYGTTTPLTAQCVLFDDGSVTLSYGSSTDATVTVLTGWSPGYGAESVAPVNLAVAVPFDLSSGSSVPLTLETSSLPLLGGTMVFTVSSPPVAPTVGLNIIGVQQANLDLGFLGAGGCSLLNSAEIIESVLLNTSVTNFSYTLPMAPALIGGSLFFQHAAYAPGANTFGFVTSNGVAVTLGDF